MSITKKLSASILGLSIMATLSTAAFAQGELIAAFDDPKGDDNGPGTYTYPTESIFKPGSFDLTRVEFYDTDEGLLINVKVGALENPWGAPNGFSIQAMDIYFDTRPGEGSTETIHDKTIPGNLENNKIGWMNAKFAAQDGWEYALRAQGWAGDLFTADGAKIPDAAKVKRLDDNTFQILLPFDTLPLTLKPGTGIAIYAFGIDWGNARTVKAQAGGWNFGGGDDDDKKDPNIIDLIVPDGVKQSDVLNYKAKSPIVIPVLRLK